MAEHVQRIRTPEEQCRVQERLLIRGNTLGGVVAAVLKLIANGEEIPAEELRSLEGDLRAWTADVRDRVIRGETVSAGAGKQASE